MSNTKPTTRAVDLEVLFIIPLEPERLEDASPFRGFGQSIIRMAPALIHLLAFPSDPRHLSLSRNDVIGERIAGYGRRILPIDTDALFAIAASDLTPLVCVVSDKTTHAAVLRWLSSRERPALHLCVDDMPNAFRLRDATPETFRVFFREALTPISAESAEAVALLRRLDAPITGWPDIKLPETARGHLALLPNEHLLQNLGYRFSDKKPLISMDDDEYAAAIVASAQPIIRERKRLILDAAGSGWASEFPGSLDMILAAPAIYRHHYSGNAWWKSRKEPERKKMRAALMAFTSQETYSTRIELPDEAEPSLPAEYLFVGQMLKSELIVFTSGVGTLAANNFCPVLRLPPAVNLLFDSVRRLGLCARSGRVNAEDKTHRTAREIAEKLGAIIPETIRECIAVDGHRLKLVCDAPIELLPVGNLPLCMAKATSRIPATPGNLMLLESLRSEKMYIHREAFSEILIIRSFSENDSVGKLLPAAIEVTRPEKFGIKVSYRDVSSGEDFIAACNEFSGALLIFDGHGFHDHETDVGGLVLGGKPVNMFSFRKVLRVPPIVILSACDTHPSDRSHASSGNTFLMLGATTVLATMLPIDGRRAALFIARLLLRLGEFLPIYTKTRPATWQEIILACLRMAYCTELVFTMEEKTFLSITKGAFPSLLLESNTLISANDPRWFDALLSNIERHSKKSRAEVDSFVQRFHQMPDSLRYVQLGSPEQIVIVSDTMVAAMEEFALNKKTMSPLVQSGTARSRTEQPHCSLGVGRSPSV